MDRSPTEAAERPVSIPGVAGAGPATRWHDEEPSLRRGANGSRRMARDMWKRPAASPSHPRNGARQAARPLSGLTRKATDAGSGRPPEVGARSGSGRGPDA